ncbi:hypothetical protein HMPREF3200_01759 [Anaerococcus tetradius]|uniref:Uncharacterized protein n=1 Tax=Anaerococcus tetradius TaxID=33036 RepID=A0A133KAJ5_9FIRM|nr:hypothetical protein HMPREF3200_01759 [Anaerococcus tetradius]
MLNRNNNKTLVFKPRGLFTQSVEVLLFYSQKTMMSYAIKAAKESINLEKEIRKKVNNI